MAQINRPAPQQDPDEALFKALNIAHTVYGIYDAGQKRDIMKQEMDAKNKHLEVESQRYKAQEGRDEKRLNIDEKRYQLEKQNKDREYDLKKSEALNQDPFKKLPEDQKNVITKLSEKNAAKIAIANQIDAVMGNWEKLDDDQKVTQGRQLLKVLNSSEGADAIGSEEAKRLGSKLEYAMGNFTNSNPMQFGRDLPGFSENAKNTSLGLKSGISANQKIINDAYGNPNRQTAMGNAVGLSAPRSEPPQQRAIPVPKELVNLSPQEQMSKVRSEIRDREIQEQGLNVIAKPKKGSK